MGAFTVGNNLPPPPTINVAANSSLYELTQVAPGAPPGSIGHAVSPIAGQLTKGNPGGVGVAAGIGISVDTGA